MMKDGGTIGGTEPSLRQIFETDYHRVSTDAKELLLNSEDLEGFDGFDIGVVEDDRLDAYAFTTITTDTADVIDIQYGYGPIDSGRGDDSITFKTESDFSTARKEKTFIVGGPGDDTIINTSVNDERTALAKIYGGSNDDTIRGSEADETIYGDEKDQIIGTWDNFKLTGLQNDEGNDKIFAGKGSDVLYGNGGNDLLDGGPRGEGFLDISTGGAGWIHISSATPRLTAKASMGVW